MERSARELEVVLGNHTVQFSVEGGKHIDKVRSTIIGLSESVNEETDYGPLDTDLIPTQTG